MIITYFNGIIICKTFLRSSFIFLLVIFSMEWFSYYFLELGDLIKNVQILSIHGFSNSTGLFILDKYCSWNGYQE